MTIYEQIKDSCKQVQEDIMQYSTVWNGKRVVIKPIKWRNSIEVYIKDRKPLEYGFTEDYLKIAEDIYNCVK